MTQRLVRAGVVAAVAAMVSFAGAGAASAQGGGAFHCSGGGWAPYPDFAKNAQVLASGSYRGLVVSGLCMVPGGAHVTITGPVTVEPGGVFAALEPGTTTIMGHVSVGAGAIFALGEPAPEGPGPYEPSHDSVVGGITATNALAVYLNNDRVTGHVSITGGGPGADCIDHGWPPIGHDLVIKDNTIIGGVTARGWAGCWAGLLRNHITGAVTWSGMRANLATDDTGAPLDPQGPDSNEILANHIAGSLSCFGNVPTAQYGDAVENPANQPPANIVTGAKRGECAAL